METGIILSMVDRSPNCPAEFEPQQYKSPEDKTAHECAPPQLNDDEVAKDPDNVTIADECERISAGETCAMEKSLTEIPRC